MLSLADPAVIVITCICQMKDQSFKTRETCCFTRCLYNLTPFKRATVNLFDLDLNGTIKIKI